MIFPSEDLSRFSYKYLRYRSKSSILLNAVTAFGAGSHPPSSSSSHIFVPDTIPLQHLEIRSHPPSSSSDLSPYLTLFHHNTLGPDPQDLEDFGAQEQSDMSNGQRLTYIHTGLMTIKRSRPKKEGKKCDSVKDYVASTIYKKYQGHVCVNRYIT